MPLNRNALIRYKTINACLRNRQRLWSLEDLRSACSEALFEYEGVEQEISKRTIQGDIFMMRSDKLGYNAPIIVHKKKYYTYRDTDYSITNIPLTDKDIHTLNEIGRLLNQFKGFTHFEDVDEIIKKIEHKVFESSDATPIIDFDRVDTLKGLHFLDDLYQSIVNRKAVNISYQSFKARNPNTFIFHPQFLKEYNNRWFVVGVKDDNEKFLNLALDRIQSIEQDDETTYQKRNVNPSVFYENVIGVTVQENSRPRKVRIFVEKQTAPYVLTKPLHKSQILEQSLEDGIVISIIVQFNPELRSRILSFGKSMKVLSPESLASRIRKEVFEMTGLYTDELYPRSLNQEITHDKDEKR